MARISVIMEFDLDGFDELSDKEKINAVESVLVAGAESCHSCITVKSVAFLEKTSSSKTE